jgi:transcriptional regulator with XRE-family HTH domain
MISIKQLRAARNLLGWSHQDVADRSGVTLNTINNVERAAVDPRKSSRHRIGGERRRGDFNGVAIDPKDPPMYESEASYLVVPPSVAIGRGLGAEGCPLRAETGGARPLTGLPKLRRAVARLTVFAFLAGCWCGVIGVYLASAWLP